MMCPVCSTEMAVGGVEWDTDCCDYDDIPESVDLEFLVNYTCASCAAKLSTRWVCHYQLCNETAAE